MCTNCFFYFFPRQPYDFFYHSVALVLLKEKIRFFWGSHLPLPAI